MRPEIVVPELKIAGATRRQLSVVGDAVAAGLWGVIFRDPRGRIIDTDAIENLVTNLGLDGYLTDRLTGGTQISTWYLMLTDGTPTVAAGDTMASHAGWTEVTAYSEAVRQTWTPGAVSGQSVDNTASRATFSINVDNTTVGGAGLTSDNAKSGTAGVLQSAGAFTGGDQTLDSGSTIEVAATFTQAAA